MLIAVRAEVESVGHWRSKFRSHSDLFRTQGVSLVHMGAANEKTVLAIFDTNDHDEFMRVFNDPSTVEAMSEDKVTGGVEVFLIDEVFSV